MVKGGNSKDEILMAAINEPMCKNEFREYISTPQYNKLYKVFS